MKKSLSTNFIVSMIVLIFILCVSVKLSAQNAYITNSSGNTISVINIATNTLIATMPSGISPDAVVVSPNGTRAYITYYGTTTNIVSTVNTATNTITNSIVLGPGFGADGIDISPDGSRLYVSGLGNTGSDTVFVVNTSTNLTIAKVPMPQGGLEGIAASPNGSKVYVANGDNIVVINVPSYTIATTIPVGSGNFLYGIAVSPDGSKIYATNIKGSIFVINTATNSIASNIVTGTATQPFGVAIKADGTKAYVGDLKRNVVYVINTSISTISDSIKVGRTLYGLALTADGSKLCIASAGTNKLYMVNTSTNSVTDSIGTGAFPVAFGKFIGPQPGQLCPNGNSILASNLVGTMYQWQVSTDGINFNTISNNTNYTGASAAILQLNNIPSAWYGYQYRCVTDGDVGSVYSLRFVDTWTGATSQAWETASNWTCGMPADANTDVFINSGSVILNSNATCRSLKVSPNASFTINPGFTLTVTH